jgi:hypothetical protein
MSDALGLVEVFMILWLSFKASLDAGNQQSTWPQQMNRVH